MTRKLLLLSAALVLALVLAGCDQADCARDDGGGDSGGDSGGDGDADADGDGDGDALPPRECELPEVECAEGEHPLYGLCVAGSERVTVAAGTFDMGAPSGDEFPAHTVNISEFVLDATEVTNEHFQACVDAGCCDPPTYDGSYSGRQPYFGNGDFARYPVVFVTWQHARDFCEGQGGRLPTEAEWEYAARGSDGRYYPWGSEDPNDSRAHYDEARDGDTAEVARHSEGNSPFGAEDMAGNVWEWVADGYSASYYTASPADDPQGPDSGAARVARGGSFGSAATEILSFYRASFHPQESFSNTGFRCAW